MTAPLPDRAPRRRALSLLVVLLVACLGLEGVQRLRLGWSRGAAEAELRELRARAVGAGAEERGAADDQGEPAAGRRFGVSAYLGYDFEDADRLYTRALARQAAAPDSFRVLLLGGSVAANFGFHGRERLLARLAADPRLAGRELDLLGFARPSHKQPQQLHALATLLALGLEPDAVINLDGFNEVAVGLDNARRGLHPVQPAAGQWLPLLGGSGVDRARRDAVAVARARLVEALDEALTSIRLSSAVLGPPLVGEARRRDRELAAAEEALVAAASEQARAGGGPVGPALPDGVDALDACVALWRDASRSLHDLCAGRGIPYVHLLQPTLHDEGSKPLSDEERASGGAAAVWVEAAREGYPRLRAAGEALRAEGVSFTDASGVFAGVEESLYHDACHFRRPGHELLAEVVADAVLGALPR